MKCDRQRDENEGRRCYMKMEKTQEMWNAVYGLRSTVYSLAGDESAGCERMSVRH